MSRFFIDRPVFAWVIAIVIMLAGVLSILSLPVSQYPPIAPPAVKITAMYPGASAKTVEDTVTQVIEQKMQGIDHLSYMSSQSDSTGNVSITLTFTAGTNPDIAQVQVQNKLQLAMPTLPQEVQQQGVRVAKASTGFLMVLGFVSDNDNFSGTDISDYVAANIQEPLSRVNGVGDLQLFGSQYAMRVWLDPNKLFNYKLTSDDIITAIKAQNAQVSAGQVGGLPALDNQQINVTVSAQTRLQKPEQFEKIVLRSNQDGSVVCLRDVARVEIGSETYDTAAFYNGRPATGLAVQLATGANALDTATAVRTRVNELSQYFPEGLSVVVPYDTTPFVRISIKEVVKTLMEAIVLVFLVMYLFLQNFRATLIPTIAVPVVLLGTFGILSAFGYSINTLTMFAMVLAIGLLVDDAIVVVENVERVMSEEMLPPKEATRKSMDQISGALVGIALVLSAVFVPMAFFGGSTGVIYRQFSITIVSAMVLSVIIALILTPALCASFLKPVAHINPLEQGGFLGRFNRLFDRTLKGYQRHLTVVLRHCPRMMLIYMGIVVVMVFIYIRMPTAFLPDEDQGVLFTQIQLPAGATREQTAKVIREVENYYLTKESASVESILSVAGFSFGGRGQNAAIAFVRLKDWEERTHADMRVAAIAQRAMKAFSGIRTALVYAFAPPAIQELGTASGFDFELQDRAGLGHTQLMAARGQLMQLASQSPLLSGVRPNGQDDTPQYSVTVDQDKAGAMGLSIGAVYRAISTAWGGSYVNDFLDKGRVKKVYLQGDAAFRMQPEDMEKWYFRNTNSDMVPFSAIADGAWTYGPARLERYNGVPAIEFLGTPAVGVSSGAAMEEMERLAKQLPTGIGYEWTGLSFQERLSGSQAPSLFALSILVVFLCLAALYESWSVPIAVMLVVPLGIIGALLASTLRGLPNDVYFQVGLLTTIGLSAKNAILIVEFAKALHEQGMDLVEATIEAARLRLRPILMTSFAFILGVLPLVRSTGAGSGSQNAIGTGVMGGMFSATVLAVYFVPVFFVVVFRLFASGKKLAVAQGFTDEDPSSSSLPSHPEA